MKPRFMSFTLAMLGTLLCTTQVKAQTCSIGGHNETSENFAAASWATISLTPGSAPPLTGSHLLISEVAPRGVSTTAGSDSSEFIEIYNPTPNPVRLDGKYISDDNNYYRIVNGTYAVVNTSDWALKFPSGLVLLPGRTLLLCTTKAGFAASGGTPGGAQIFLEMKDSNANLADDMVLMTPNSLFPPIGGMLTNPGATAGEWVVLYCWNGTSDLVCDIDYASFGGNNASNPKMDKTGIAIDGPDAGAVASAYNADTPAATQSNLGSGTTLTKPLTYQRVAPESGEITFGGNGCVGKVIPSAVDWLPVAGPLGETNIRFHVRWHNPDEDAMSTPFQGQMSSQEFGVFLPDMGLIGSFNVPPMQPNSFFDVFFEVPLSALPPAPQKILPGGGPGGLLAHNAALESGGARTNANCPPDTNWAGNVDIFWSGQGQGGQVNRHYADLLTCPGGPPSYIHFRGSNCTSPMPWSLLGVCPGYSVTLVNEDFSAAPNPVPVGWSGWICVSTAAAVPTGSSCCFGVVFQCNGATSTIDICSTACDWQVRKPVLTAIDWTNTGTTVHFHQHWENSSTSGPSDPVSGTMKSQPFGVFLPDYGPIGAFNVPPIAVNSFFDVFFDVDMSQLPPEPVLRLPGSIPGTPNPCLNDHWHGNVNIDWNGPGGAGQAFKHFGEMPVCPGAGPTYLFVETDCLSAVGATWSISGLCSGFTATLANTDSTPAPNPVPPGWIGLICVSATAATPVGTTCCFQVHFMCNGVEGVIDVCAKTCNWRPTPPVLTAVDWTTTAGVVTFHQHWENQSTSAPSAPVSGDMSSQALGVFLPNFGPIGHFDVPPIAPNSFFDVFFDVPLAQLPPEPAMQLPPGLAGTPCLPTQWHGNVDLIWASAGGTGNANYHFDEVPLCPGDRTLVHVETGCASPVGAMWSVSGLCSGFTATLLNPDLTLAPNPLPFNWNGFIAVTAAAGTPAGTTCCFKIDFLCDGVPATIRVCAKVCDCTPRRPRLHKIDWKKVGTNVRFHMEWGNPDTTGDSEPVSGNMKSQPFGAFLPDFGPIGHFDVPPIPPSSFFDVFIEVPLASLPPEPQEQLPGGGPVVGDPCPEDTSWSGNVDINWAGTSGASQTNYHFTSLLVRPGSGTSHIHALIFCNSALGSNWAIAGLCPGFTATLLNEDFTAAPNPVPPNWTGWISVGASVAVPAGTTCCFSVTFLCDNQPGVINVCATTCLWQLNSTEVPGRTGMDFGIRSTTPNPTNAEMAIGFSLPQSGKAKVEIYNLGGQRVRTLLDGNAEAGMNTVRWDGRGENGRVLPPGAYFVALKAGPQVASRKIVLFH